MSEDSGNDKSESSDARQAPLDWARKLLALGVGAAFLTEESIRGLVQDFKLPKELLGAILENATRLRKDFIQNFSAELMSKISEKVDPQIMISEFFRRNDVTLEVKIKVKDKSPD